MRKWFNELEKDIMPPANKSIGYLKIAFVWTMKYLSLFGEGKMTTYD